MMAAAVMRRSARSATVLPKAEPLCGLAILWVRSDWVTMVAPLGTTIRRTTYEPLLAKTSESALAVSLASKVVVPR